MKNSSEYNPRQNKIRLQYEKLAHAAYVHQVHQHLKINRSKLKKQECQMKYIRVYLGQLRFISTILLFYGVPRML